MEFLTNSIFLILFIVLLIGWAVSWAVFHIAGGLIHILLIVAFLSLVMHFFRARSQA